jgi:glycopeptide antibiotics resistance protein
MYIFYNINYKFIQNSKTLSVIIVVTTVTHKLDPTLDSKHKLADIIFIFYLIVATLLTQIY